MVASYDLMLELFVDCNGIREFCNRLQSDAERVQEISMNAAIAAGHTGTHMRTFGEIARQIGNSSARMTARIQRIRSNTNKIANVTLEAMITAAHLTQFRACENTIQGEANQMLLRSRILDFERTICQSIGTIFKDVQLILADLKATDEIQKRIWAVVTRLRIEASVMATEQQVFVSTIADSLDDLLSKSQSVTEPLYETIRDFESKLVCPQVEMEGELKYVS